MSAPEPNAFVSMLRDLQGGATQAELHTALKQLVEECERTGKPGTLQLTLKVAPKAGQMIVTDDIRLAPPKPERAVTVMFPDKGRLTRRDPRQPRLEGVPESDVRQFPAAVGEENVDRRTGEIKEP